MKVGKVICRYMDYIIRNSKVKFHYDMTTDEGHTFIREDYKNGFTIPDSILDMFLTGNKVKADFTVSKGIFWLERRK